LCEAVRLELRQLDTQLYLDFYSQKGMKAVTHKQDVLPSELTRRGSGGSVRSLERKEKR
jgi:hypothetical protein